MGGGAWNFLVGGVICLVNPVNEQDLSLLTSTLRKEPLGFRNPVTSLLSLVVLAVLGGNFCIEITSPHSLSPEGGDV